MAGSDDHQVNDEGQAIRHSRCSDEYHDASRHPLGNVHIVKPALDEKRGNETRDGGALQSSAYCKHSGKMGNDILVLANCRKETTHE